MAKIKLTNNVISNNIIVEFNDKTLYIKKNEHKIIDVVPKSVIKIKVSLDRKNKISLKWFNVLLTEPIDTDARSVICYDYICKINVQNDMELIFSDNIYRTDDTLKLISVCAVSSRESILEEKYTLPNNKKPKTKHAILQLVLLSGLPIIIAGIIYSFFKFQIGVVIAVIILFILATIPSIKSIKKFNNNLEKGNSLLTSSVHERCDYDRIEKVANDIIKDEKTNGIAKVAAKILKHFINSL